MAKAPRGRAPGAVRGGIARERHSVLFGGARRRRRSLVRPLLPAVTVAAVLAIVPVAAQTPAPEPTPLPTATASPTATVTPQTGGSAYPPIAWRRSRAVGEPADGRLVRGVQLPGRGPDWFTWDPVLNRAPNRGWRRWGTDGLLRTLIAVLADYRATHPSAPRVGVMDLSRPRGGPFGPDFGGLGHLSHQNGLDADVLYPRRDEAERRPLRPRAVHRQRAQHLVDLFVAAGAEKVFVGPSLRLRGPRDVVIPLIHHDDHLHVRLPPRPHGTGRQRR